MAYIDQWLTRLANLKEQEAMIEKERRDLEDRIIHFLDGNESDSIESTVGSEHLKATIVRSTTLKFDEHGLASELSPHMWREVTRRVLDTKALEDKVARGAIDVEVVAKYSDEVPRKPYVRLSRREA